MKNTLTLPGPYGTQLEDRGLGGNPFNVFTPEGQQARQEIAESYIKSGADVLTSNTFFPRALIESSGGEQLYREVIGAEWDVTTRAYRNRINQNALLVITAGPKGDCYAPNQAPGRQEAMEFHDVQLGRIQELNTIDPDFVLFETVNTVDEAVGQASAAQRRKAPCVISFTLDGQGALLSGEPLQDAIAAVDSLTVSHPLGFMLNCCRPQDLEKALLACALRQRERVIGVYPNAATSLVGDLDGSEGIVGVKDPKAMATYLNYLAKKYPHIRFLGGCCGYDPRSIWHISDAIKKGLISAEVPLGGHGIDCDCC